MSSMMFLLAVLCLLPCVLGGTTYSTLASFQAANLAELHYQDFAGFWNTNGGAYATRMPSNPYSFSANLSVYSPTMDGLSASRSGSNYGYIQTVNGYTTYTFSFPPMTVNAIAANFFVVSVSQTWWVPLAWPYTITVSDGYSVQPITSGNSQDATQLNNFWGYVSDKYITSVTVTTQYGVGIYAASRYMHFGATVPVCPENCTTCNVQFCTSCPYPLSVQDGLCMPDCPYGTYYSDYQCLFCAVDQCTKCNSETSCQSCAFPYFAQPSETDCQPGCPPGYYGDQITRACLPCPANCELCYQDLTGVVCIDCEDPYSTYNSTCVSTCPSGTWQTYNPMTSVCYPCDAQHCDQCPDNQCESCLAGFLSYAPYPAVFECLETCPEGTLTQGTECLPCMQGCSTCTQPGSDGDCTQCAQYMYYYEGPQMNECIWMCPPRTFTDNTDMTCKDCPANCEMCSDENTCTYCTWSYEIQPDGSCESICPSDQIYSPWGCTYTPGYVGCLIEPANINANQTSASMTVDTCVEFCRTHGNIYAGIDQGNQCKCMNSWTDSHNATKCTVPCAGNATETCGGPSADVAYQSVYRTCVEPCSACDDYSTCTQCNQGAFLNGTDCVGWCGDGLVGITDAQGHGTCQPCSVDGSCDVCTEDFVCMQCHEGYLANGACQLTCPVGHGYTISPAGDCYSCSDFIGPQCVNCTYQHGIMCTECSSGTNLWNGGCITCGTGTYFDQGSCAGCPSNCDVCTSSTECTQCSSGIPILYGGQCLSSCPTGHYDNGAGSCGDCIAHCDVCSGSSGCSTCSNGFIYHNGQCLSSCPSGTYSNNGGCANCIANCSVCSGSSGCTTCKTGFSYYNGQCLSSCPTGMYSNNGVCEACIAQCDVCSASSGCTTCSTGFSYYNGQCLSSCPTGTYSNNGVCANCGADCDVCSSPSVCTTCTSGFGLLSGYCYSICGVGMWMNNGVCDDCMANCDECSGSTVCYKCTTGYNRYSNGCVSTCPDGTYADSGVCFATTATTATTQQATSQQATSQQATSQQATTQQATSQQATTQQATTQQATSQQATTQQATTQQATTQQATSQQATTQQTTTQQATSQQATTQQATTQQATSQQATSQQSTTQQATSQQATTQQATTQQATTQQATSQQATSQQATSQQATSQQATSQQATSQQATTQQATTQQATTQQATTQQATTQQATTQQATTQQATTQQATTQQATSQQATSQQATTQQATSQQATSQQATSQQATTQQATSQQATSQQATSQQATTQQATSQQATTQQATSQQATSQQATSQQATSQQATSQQATSQQATSQQATSQQATSQQVTSQQATSQQATSQQATSQQATSQQATSQQATSQQATSQTSTTQSSTTQQPSTTGNAGTIDVYVITITHSVSLDTVTQSVVENITNSFRDLVATQLNLSLSDVNVTVVPSSKRSVFASSYKIIVEIIVRNTTTSLNDTVNQLQQAAVSPAVTNYFTSHNITSNGTPQVSGNTQTIPNTTSTSASTTTVISTTTGDQIESTASKQAVSSFAVSIVLCLLVVFYL